MSCSHWGKIGMTKIRIYDHITSDVLEYYNINILCVQVTIQSYPIFLFLILKEISLPTIAARYLILRMSMGKIPG